MIINVNTSKAYEIEIKKHLLDETGPRISRLFRPAKCCIITDENVHRLYTGKVEKSLKAAGFEVHKIVFSPGESTKNMNNLFRILRYLASEGFTSSDFLIALGGGVIGDLTGFAAAIYMRGISYIQMPSSLLAMVDSSVGGKTAIDLPEGKNLAGAFWQPEAVYMDTACLETLSKSQLQCGIIEMIKAAVILDPSLFELFNTHKPQELGSFIEDAIIKSVGIKKRIVETDENEKGIRKVLNLGHTIGHSVEKLSSYNISHGHALASGLMIAAGMAKAGGWAEENLVERLFPLYEKYGFKADYGYSPAELAKGALSDKKRRGDIISLVIPKAMGNVTVKDIHISRLEDLIAAGLELIRKRSSAE